VERVTGTEAKEAATAAAAATAAGANTGHPPLPPLPHRKIGGASNLLCDERRRQQPRRRPGCRTPYGARSEDGLRHRERRCRGHSAAGGRGKSGARPLEGVWRGFGSFLTGTSSLRRSDGGAFCTPHSDKANASWQLARPRHCQVGTHIPLIGQRTGDVSSVQSKSSVTEGKEARRGKGVRSGFLIELSIPAPSDAHGYTCLHARPRHG
jgi:hypothetical protein